MNTTTNLQTAKSPHVLIWIASIVVILFSAAGIAAIMGWIPTSMGRFANNTETTAPGRVSANEAQLAAARTHTPTQPYTPPVHRAGNTPVKTACIDCGVIESTREITHKGESSGLGAVDGNEAGKRVKANKSYEVTVRLDDGSSRVISQATPSAWLTGDHVKIVESAIQAI